MQNEEKNNGVQPQLGGTPEVDIESAETGSYQSVEHPSRPRKDKARLHATRHGILSRPLLEALARRGENIRQLRGIERALREDLRPVGVFAELLFDRMWSSFLRCLLIARSEARVLTSDGPPSDLPLISHLPKLEKPSFSFDDVSPFRLQQLALSQRYDAHFSRDFFRAMGLLMALRDGGKAELTRQLDKTLGKNKDVGVD